MKNVDELYEKYYNAYKSGYDTDDELKEDKKKKFDYKQFELDDKTSKESKLDEKTKKLKLTELTKWIKVSKKRLDTIKYVVQNARKNNLQARPQHASPINFTNSNKLIHEIVHGNITHEEALNKMADINNNFGEITELKSFNSNQIKVVNTYFMMSEIFTGVAKELMENNKGEIYLKKSKSDHSDEQK